MSFSGFAAAVVLEKVNQSERDLGHWNMVYHRNQESWFATVVNRSHVVGRACPTRHKRRLEWPSLES